MIQDKWLGKNLIERKEYIKEVLGNGSPSQRAIEIGENIFKECQIHQLDVNLPISRLCNIRTKSSQMNWLAINQDKKSDFFTNDPECREALSVQQDLLFNIANSGGEKNFYENFKNGVKFRQDEPIIINSKGVMINGNTRMSAIRKLLDEDELAYQHLLKIPMAILPPEVTEDDERFLELRYQVRPDWQKNYSWVSEAIDCREKIENGVSIEKIIKEFGRDTQKQIRSNSIGHPQNLLDQLEVGDIFLDALGCPGMYSKIDGTPNNAGETVGTQYAMWEWSKMRSDYDDNPEEQTLLDSVCVDFLIQALKRDIEGRLLIIIKDLRKNWHDNKDKYIEALRREDLLKEENAPGDSVGKEETDSTETAQGSGQEENAPEGDATSDDGSKEKLNPYDTLELDNETKNEPIERPVIKKQRDSKKVVSTIIAVNDNIREKKTREKNKSYIYKGIIEIKSKLSEYKLSLAEEEREFSDINLALEELTNINSLLDEIKTLMNDRNES